MFFWTTCLLAMAATSCFDSKALRPTPGLFEYRAFSQIDVAGGRVDAAGGNMVIRRMAFSIDTLLGTREVGAVYNSANRSWIWSFQASYDGETLVDETGALHDVRAVEEGAAIPGTHWRKLDAERISTKGGLVHHFEPLSHRLDRISWGENEYPALVFSGEWVGGTQRTVAVEQCTAEACFDVYSLGYDEHGCVASLEDRAGREVEMLNDEQCRILTARDPLDMAKEWVGQSYEYDAGNLAATTSSEGVRFEYAYLDGRLLAVSRSQSAGGITLFSHGFSSGSGLYFTRVIGPDAGVRQYSYDEQGRLHEFKDALGSTLEMEWIGLRPSRLTDFTGGSTTWDYSDDDPIRVVQPDGNVIEIDYTKEACRRNQPFSTPKSRVADSLGEIEYNVYGFKCWVVTTIQSDGDYVVYNYNEEGLVVSVNDVREKPIWFFDYGEHGHAERITKSGLVQIRRFDEVGNLVAGSRMMGALDPGRPGVVSRSFDANRNLIGLELEGGTDADPLVGERVTIEVEYRSDGQPSLITRPYGGDTRFDYDAAGNRVARSERVDGQWQTTRYEYAASGWLRATEWPNGIRQEVDHDATGEVVARRFMREGEVEKTLRSIWSSGRLVSRFDSERPGEERIFYDEVGREVAIHFPEGEVIEFYRDLRGREIERLYRLHDGAPPIRTLSWAYDGEDRIIEIWDEGKKEIERHYEWGRLKREVFGNGLETEFTHNEDSGLLEEEFTSQSAGPSSSIHVETFREWAPCGYMSNYCVTSKTFARLDENPMTPFVSALESYQIGPLWIEDSSMEFPGARVQSWSSEDVAEGAHVGQAEYGFDALGNWIGVWERGEERVRFSYNGERNRLIAADLVDQHVYTWDEAGFMQSRDEESLVWDAAGRPTQLGAEYEMRWDSLGRPISYRVGEQMSFSLFGGGVMGDADRMPIRIDLRSIEIDLTTGDHTYRQLDHRGNVHFVMNQAGEISNLYSYSPFGVAEEWGPGSNGRTFAQGQKMGEYIWLENRLYDPEVGRFLSPDPVYQLVNQFSYTLGNPIFFWDPGGRHSSPNPLVSLGKKIMKFADRLQAMGYAAFATALNSGSYSSALSALASVVAGITLKWSIEQMCSACTPDVRIEDPPFADQPEQGEVDSSGPESPTEVSTCSPQVLQAEPARMHRGWIWAPLQLLLAVFLLRIARRSGTR